MAAILGRTIYCTVALLAGFATMAIVASVTSPMPAAANRLSRHEMIGVDAWCMPSTCTSVGKSVPDRLRDRFE